MQQSYTPSTKTLEKYADLIVKFGLQNRAGKPAKNGSVVHFVVPEAAKPLYFHLQRAILKNGHHPLGTLLPGSTLEYNFEKSFFELANKKQLDFCPETYHKGLIDQADCTIRIITADTPELMEGVSPTEILQRSQSMKKVGAYRFAKINADKLKWTLALYGTDQGAKNAGMPIKEYWSQITKACYLNEKNPVSKWKQINKAVQTTAQKLTDLQIKSVHVTGEDIDLHVGIGKNRAWRAGGGNNIPSYEVFTSPNFRETQGWARFNQPHFRYGKKIEGIELWFKNGKVVKSKASKNHDLLKSMLKTPGGNFLGEFSLTDARLSKITKFMAEILYDENTGGKYGNTHVALGSAYRDCYTGDISKVKKGEWKKLGYNSSVVHSDIISTTDRTATATLYDGTEVVIYKNGKFTV